MISKDLNSPNIENAINLRGYIIQHSTHLEKIMSLALCEILGIDIKKSLSFGYKGFALSFDHKINLLADLKNVGEYKSKFQIFKEIRNKFAHIFEVTSFADFTNLTDDTKKSINKLIKLYGNQSNKSETDLLKYFNKLYYDLFEYIIDIAIKNAYFKGKIDGESNSLKLFYDSILEQCKESDNEKLKIVIKNSLEKINRTDF